MKLYRFPGTRANRPQWVIEELGLDCEYVDVNVMKGEHKTPGYYEMHPHGLLPVLEDGDLRMIESAAMVMHLADKHPEGHLAPAPGTPERAMYYQYIVYAVSTLDEHVIPIFFHSVLLPADKRRPEVVERSRPVWGHAAKFLERCLSGRPYLVGDKFSAADICVGYDLMLAQQAGLLDGHETLKDYTHRLTERPAFKRAYGR